ncbi:hypothetical protein [Bartonella florencae]|uniref:hypothetical protein n=1 Tax=Bartonella florencae TaxID=928210 RepID=UPI0002E9EDD0|nr:hypothetical protein [Bartonella florencae]
MTAFFLISVILLAIFTNVMISSAFLMVIVSTSMTIFAIYYSFFKRAGLLFCTVRKLKKAALQKLGRYKKHNREQNAGFGKQLNAVAFKESLALSRRESKVILWILLIMFFPFVCLAIFGAFYPRSVMLLADLAVKAPVLSKVVQFIFQGWAFAWGVIVVFLPVFLIFHVFLNWGVKKTIKKLEKLA